MGRLLESVEIEERAILSRKPSHRHLPGPDLAVLDMGGVLVRVGFMVWFI